MTDDRFDELMRDAAQTFNRPPEAPLDEMWDVVERTAWNAAPVTTAETRTSRFSLRAPGWAIAATLIVGIGLGRASVIFNRTSSTQPIAQAPSPVTTVASVRTKKPPLCSFAATAFNALLRLRRAQAATP